MKLNFKISDDLLIIHTLSSMASDRFSSTKDRKDIIAFQNYAWKKCESCYNALVGRLLTTEMLRDGLQKTLKHLPGFLKELKASRSYRKVRSQTDEYLKFCSNQWDTNYKVASKAVKELTGLKLNKKIDIYITHPSLKNGIYRGDNIIEWGHHEDWLNYATIYLWHEILHSYIGRSDVEHAIIELVIDEELRAVLNKGKRLPSVGHKYLGLTKRRLLPYWKRYLKSKRRNINDFIKKSKQL